MEGCNATTASYRALHEIGGHNASRLALNAPVQDLQRSLGLHSAAALCQLHQSKTSSGVQHSLPLTSAAAQHSFRSYGSLNTNALHRFDPQQDQQSNCQDNGSSLRGRQSWSAEPMQTFDSRHQKSYFTGQQRTHRSSSHCFITQRHALGHAWLPRRSSSSNSSSSAPAETAVEAANPSPAPATPQQPAGSLQAPLAIQSVLSPQQVYDKVTYCAAFCI